MKRVTRSGKTPEVHHQPIQFISYLCVQSFSSLFTGVRPRAWHSLYYCSILAAGGWYTDLAYTSADYFIRQRNSKRRFVNKHLRLGPSWLVCERCRTILFSRRFTSTAIMFSEMKSYFIENDSVDSISLSELSSSSSVSDRACVHWGKIISVLKDEPLQLLELF